MTDGDSTELYAIVGAQRDCGATRRRRARRVLWYASATMTALWIASPAPAALAGKTPKPVTLKVNTTTDSAGTLHGKKLCGKKAGQCSLRAAVEEADKPKPGKAYTIVVPAGEYVLTLGPLAVTQGTAAIDGAGAASTAISGGGASQVLTVSPGAHLSTQSLTLTEGASEEPGGALENRGTTTILDSVVSKSSGGEGGGIYNASGATLEIRQSTLTEDSTEEGHFYGEEQEEGGNGGNGGAIANAGSLTVEGGAISSSYAGRGAFSNGNGGGTGGTGGGIFNTGNATLTDVTVESDFAGSGGLGYNEPSGAGGGGGGVYNQGGTMTVNLGVFAGDSSGAAGYNLTDPEGRAPGDGGGIDNAQGTVHVQGTSFTADTGGLGRFSTGGSGGAISNAAHLTVTGATFNSNSGGTGGYGGTGGNGGAIYNTGSGSVTTSSFLHDTAGVGGESLPGGAGGAVFNTGTLEVSASTLAFECGGRRWRGWRTRSRTGRTRRLGRLRRRGREHRHAHDAQQHRVWEHLRRRRRRRPRQRSSRRPREHRRHPRDRRSGHAALRHDRLGCGRPEDSRGRGDAERHDRRVEHERRELRRHDRRGIGLQPGQRRVLWPLARHRQVRCRQPGLGPLAANGGPTETLAPLAGSPAIDAGGTAAQRMPVGRPARLRPAG